MLKPFFIIIAALLFYKTAVAQQDTTVYYLNASGGLVSTKQEAVLFVVVLPPDSGAHKDLFMVNGYYLDGKKLFEGASFTKTFPLKLQGAYITYFANGPKMSIKHFDKGELTGDEILFYPNGRFYSKKTYVTTMDIKVLHFMDCSDSTGIVLAKNGKGSWITFNDTFTRIIEQGKVVNGLKDSVWASSPTAYGTFPVTYKNGEKLWNNIDGKKINTFVSSSPEFPGGLNTFYKYIAINLRYPTAARRNNTQGRVVVSFAVERDGSLTDVKVVRGIGDGCDEEAARVIRDSPKWRPGIQNGKPVRVIYSVPINFSLTGN